MADATESIVRVEVAHHAHTTKLDATYFARLKMLKLFVLIKTVTSWASSLVCCEQHRVDGFIHLEIAPRVFVPKPVTPVTKVSIAAFTTVSIVALFVKVLVVRYVLTSMKI